MAMQNSTSMLEQDLVLLGGGHSHALVLLRWAMNPLPGVRVTLISESSESPYSGMLPGLVAGHYQRDDVYIDLRKLCRHAGVRFIQARVLGLNPAAQTVALEDRPAIAYDLLSINVGATPDLSVDGAALHAIPVKPIAQFWPAWQQQRDHLLQQDQPQDIAVVGGGAGSVELVLAMAHALRASAVRHRFHLVSRGERLLPGYPAVMLRWLQRRLDRHHVQVHLNAEVKQVTPEQLQLQNGRVIPASTVFWCTQAKAASWLATSELDVTAAGFVRVLPTLQTLRWPNIFAAGDCAWIDATPTARAGVYAVRQAPILDHNFRQFFLQRPLRHYRPQHHFLSLLATGDKDAVGARGALPLAGRWLWRWKDRIDRRFMTMLQQLPVQPPAVESNLVSLEPPAMRCGGCGGKVGADVLQQALSALHSECVVGSARDDAAIIPLSDDSQGRVLVQSVDALKPLLDDPYLMGRIATLHALSDLFAMNATPHSAQLQLQVPLMQEVLQVRDLQQVLQGVQRELAAAGASLLGGHTLEADNLQIGLVVNGFTTADRVLKKGGVQGDDVFILTRPLGIGVLFAAAMRGYSHARWIDAALPHLLQSNGVAAQILASHDAHALTDITGFGLAGHWLEMLDASGVGAVLSLAAMPLLEGAIECVQAGYRSTLSPANQRARHRLTLQQVDAEDPRYTLLFDPQTQGGLLAAVPITQAENCLRQLRQHYQAASIVGQCRAGQGLIIQP